MRILVSVRVKCQLESCTWRDAFGSWFPLGHYLITLYLSGIDLAIFCTQMVIRIGRLVASTAGEQHGLPEHRDRGRACYPI